MKSNKTAVFLVVVVLVVIFGLGIIYAVSHKNSTNDTSSQSNSEGDVAGVNTQDSSKDPAWIEGLAKYLTEKGMVMYGAYWCSHCKAQKEEFGNAVKYIDYVECDASGPNANPDECKANNIEGYPTWIYQGKQYSGEQSLEKLAQITGYDQENSAAN